MASKRSFTGFWTVAIVRLMECESLSAEDRLATQCIRTGCVWLRTLDDLGPGVFQQFNYLVYIVDSSL